MKTFQKLTVTFLFGFITILGAAQTSRSATASIPFKFWIGARELPAGDYAIDHVDGPDVLLFHTKDQKYIEQVFLIPARGPVVDGDPKLVFIVRNGKYYLAELWGPSGKRILTTEYRAPVQQGDSRREVPIQK